MNAGPDSFDAPIPGDGKIVGSSIVSTILAIAFLILVTLISFLGVAVIGKLLDSNQATYWLIELIFAILCAGAGALVGGSADVRSTLNIPGSPAQARLGGAIAMVIVGFALASLGKPANSEEKRYTIQIQNVQHAVELDNVKYNLVVSPVDDDMSIMNRGNVVTISIPSSIQRYTARLVIFRSDRENPRILARCPLTFDSENGPEIRTKEIVPDPVFRIYLSQKYVDKVVHKSIATGHVVEDEPCVEGGATTDQGERKLLNGYFTLVPVGIVSWFLNVAHISAAPPYAMMASVVAKDLPPIPLPGGGVTSQEPTGPAAQAPPPSAPSSQTSASAQTAAPAVAPAQPPVAAPAPASSPPPIVPSNASSTAQTLDAQVDAYVQGQNLDRTQLYQNWHQVADYIVPGFRTAVNNGSPLAARYINLIANALNVIDDGKYLAPTLRPNGDQFAKPDRLGQKIPGFVVDDYYKAVQILCSTDADSRAAAQRLLRSFPADDFYKPLQNLQRQSSCMFASESAVYYFYNRIVEYDGKFSLDATSINWLNGNYDDGGGWVKLSSAKESNQDVFGALLDFAYGVTLWDRGPNSPANQANGLSHFRLMLQTLGSSKGIYPSNPHHIAIALKALNNPDLTSKTASSAAPYSTSALHPVSGNYITSGTGVRLFALPDTSSKQIGNVSGVGSVRIYLRAENWDMVQAGAQFGWAQRTLTNAEN
jgi:hypothetical protein